MDKKKIINKKEEKLERFKYLMLGDIKEGKGRKEYLYPYLYHSRDGIGFNVDPDDDYMKVLTHVQNELGKIPGQPYRLQQDQKYYSIDFYKRKFEDTKKPLYLIRAFLAAFDAGVYPPPWVLDFVVERFREFDKSLGEKSLDNLFGFARGKGNRHFETNFLKETRDELLCRDIFHLQGLCGISVKNAGEVVTALLSKDPTYGTAYTFERISADTIATTYTRKYVKKFRKDPVLKWSIDRILKQKTTGVFLSKFPKDAIEVLAQSYPTALNPYL